MAVVSSGLALITTIGTKTSCGALTGNVSSDRFPGQRLSRIAWIRRRTIPEPQVRFGRAAV